jgi:hypothetical protein
MTAAPFMQTSLDQQCADHLRRIYTLLKLYLHHSAGVLGFPSRLDRISGMTKDLKVFVCPADKQIQGPLQEGPFQTSYEVVSNPLAPRLSSLPANRVAIVVEKSPNHESRRFVLFYDGSVKVFDQVRFDELKSNLFIDRRNQDK